MYCTATSINKTKFESKRRIKKVICKIDRLIILRRIENKRANYVSILDNENANKQRTMFPFDSMFLFFLLGIFQATYEKK